MESNIDDVLSKSNRTHRSVFGGPKRYSNSPAVNDKNNDAMTVRRGHKNKRRLSRVTLGKNLQLNQASGLKLQWTVGN